MGLLGAEITPKRVMERGWLLLRSVSAAFHNSERN